jgi:hypothetical protein
MAEDSKSEPRKSEKKPPTKDELVAVAIERGVPSYEAWAMTVDELKKKVG